MSSEHAAATLRSRFAAVMFADVTGSTRLYATQGDTVGHRTIRGCIDLMRRATETAGGRVVKTIGDEILSVFSAADAAARAAIEMHMAVENLPDVAGTKLQLRIGVHGGPVLQKENDIFGDTVNLAARLAGQAVGGQVLLTRATAAGLAPDLRVMARELYGVKVKGKTEEIELCELVWKADENATVILSGPRPRAKAATLKLAYKGRELPLRRDADAIVIGRDQDCGLAIADHMASRRHCTIERRLDKFVVKDHSTNGTYVTIEGEAEISLRREELILRKRGWIACGQPKVGTDDAVEFACE
ncbi:MAG: adenylate/guanylate cyclase domain-containing protein [Betaproteobacteria bacterium]|nr:adenylate/guanylate cyclase domain-containing protein [Betaproteobacteria bacterium]